MKQLGFWLNSWKWRSLLLFSSKGFTLPISFSLNPSVCVCVCVCVCIWLPIKFICIKIGGKEGKEEVHFWYCVIYICLLDELGDGEFVGERCIWEEEVYEFGGLEGSPPSNQRLYTLCCLWSSSFYPKGWFWI